MTDTEDNLPMLIVHSKQSLCEITMNTNTAENTALKHNVPIVYAICTDKNNPSIKILKV